MTGKNTGTLATEAATAAMLDEAATVSPTSEVTPAQPTPPTERMFTAEQLEEARRQEKDKLYPKIGSLEERLKVFEDERQEALRKAEEAAAEAARLQREREEQEMSVRDLLSRKEDEWKSTFNTAQQEWEQKFNALQAESEARAALLERERQYQELKTYTDRRLAEEAANIMPELLDLVGGNTPEEIESSIQAAVAKTSAIVQSIQQALPQQQQRPRGIPTTGGTPSGPLENSTEQQTFTDSDLKSMDMTTYAANRERLLAAVSRRQ